MLSASQQQPASPDSRTTTSARTSVDTAPLPFAVLFMMQHQYAFMFSMCALTCSRVFCRLSPLVQHCPGLLYPEMAYGHILAAFWSPDSSRLLIYNDCSCASQPPCNRAQSIRVPTGAQH